MRILPWFRPWMVTRLRQPGTRPNAAIVELAPVSAGTGDTPEAIGHPFGRGSATVSPVSAGEAEHLRRISGTPSGSCCAVSFGFGRGIRRGSDRAPVLRAACEVLGGFGRRAPNTMFEGHPVRCLERNAPAASAVGADQRRYRAPSPRSFVQSAFVSCGDVVTWRAPLGGNTGRHRGADPGLSRRFGSGIGRARCRERSSGSDVVRFRSAVCVVSVRAREVVSGCAGLRARGVSRSLGGGNTSLVQRGTAGCCNACIGLAARRAGSPARWTSNLGLHRVRVATQWRHCSEDCPSSDTGLPLRLHFRWNRGLRFA